MCHYFTLIADKLISKQHLSSPDVFGSLNAARKRLQSAHKSAPKCCILLYDSDVTVTDYMETEAKAMHSNNITIVSVGKVTQVISVFAYITDSPVAFWYVQA